MKTQMKTEKDICPKNSERSKVTGYKKFIKTILKQHYFRITYFNVKSLYLRIQSYVYQDHSTKNRKAAVIGVDKLTIYINGLHGA